MLVSMELPVLTKRIKYELELCLDLFSSLLIPIDTPAQMLKPLGGWNEIVVIIITSK